MSEVTLVTDHVARALNRLPLQWKASANDLGMLTALATQVQEIEDAFIDLTLTRIIADADDATLDGIGAIVGMNREARDTATFRLAIQAQILINRGSGQINNIIAIAKLLVPNWASNTVTLTEVQPARYIIESLISGATIDPTLAEKVAFLLKSATAAGVAMNLRYNTTMTSAMFSFFGGGGLGFGLGELAGVYDGH